MAGTVTEVKTTVSADVTVEIWIRRDTDGERQPLYETRTLKVSLSDQLDSSDEIRGAFARLAEVAVHGASREART